MLVLDGNVMHDHGVVHTQYRSLIIHKRVSDMLKHRGPGKTYAKYALQLEDRAVIQELAMEIPSLPVVQLQKMAWSTTRF